MNCFRCSHITKSKKILKPLPADKLEITLTQETDGYGGWMPKVSDSITKIIEQVKDKINENVADPDDLKSQDKVKRLKLKYMEKFLSSKTKYISLSPDRFSLLVGKSRKAKGVPTQYSLDKIQV